MKKINKEFRKILFLQYCNHFEVYLEDTRYVDVFESFKNFKNMLTWRHDTHCGDCTNVAMSCLKCNAHDIIDDAKVVYRLLNKVICEQNI